jgi:hypothetical protein
MNSTDNKTWAGYTADLDSPIQAGPEDHRTVPSRRLTQYSMTIGID